MNDPNYCKKFTIRGNTCPDVWGSIEGSELLLDIVEAERHCKRNNDMICTKSTIDQLRDDEILFWDCLDSFCNQNSDRLVDGRKKFLSKLDKAFHKFKDSI